MADDAWLKRPNANKRKTMTVASVPPFDATPTGLLALDMAAQGCGFAATLGNAQNKRGNPNGVVSMIEYATPLGLVGHITPLTQGCDGTAPLG
jgi:hypothetical protein